MKKCLNPECGKDFEPNHGKQQFCSVNCRVAAARAKKKGPEETSTEAKIASNISYDAERRSEPVQDELRPENSPQPKGNAFTTVAKQMEDVIKKRRGW